MDLTLVVEFLYQNPWLPLGTGIVIILAGLMAIRRLLSSEDQFWPEDEPNKVSLYQFQRGPYAPSFSPFCLKLETYLRMASVPYKNVHCMKMSSKGKMPWIRYNGASVADSQLCMEFINKKFDVDLNFRLTRTDRAVARAFVKLLEDSLVMYGALERFVHATDKPWLADAGIPRLIRWVFRGKVKKALYYQGYGRHTREELHEIMVKDIQAVSDYLGGKRFMMGPEPCELDCTAFGVLVQITLNMSGSGADVLIKDKHPQLLDYCDRMRRRYWPDWDECITDGGKRKATK